MTMREMKNDIGRLMIIVPTFPVAALASERSPDAVSQGRFRQCGYITLLIENGYPRLPGQVEQHASTSNGPSCHLRIQDIGLLVPAKPASDSERGTQPLQAYRSLACSLLRICRIGRAASALPHSRGRVHCSG